MCVRRLLCVGRSLSDDVDGTLKRRVRVGFRGVTCKDSLLSSKLMVLIGRGDRAYSSDSILLVDLI